LEESYKNDEQFFEIHL